MPISQRLGGSNPTQAPIGNTTVEKTYYRNHEGWTVEVYPANPETVLADIRRPDGSLFEIWMYSSKHKADVGLRKEGYYSLFCVQAHRQMVALTIPEHQRIHGMNDEQAEIYILFASAPPLRMVSKVISRMLILYPTPIHWEELTSEHCAWWRAYFRMVNEEWQERPYIIDTEQNKIVSLLDIGIDMEH